MHNVQFTPLIGLPQFNGWSQAVMNDHQTVIVVFSVTGTNAGNIGRDLVIQIKDSEISSVEQFYDWLETLITETEQLGVELDITAAWLTEMKIAYAVKGGAVILKRGEKVGVALTSPKLQLILGPYTADDLIVLVTHQAQSYLGEIQQKLIQGYAPEVIVKSLTTSVHTMPDSATIAFGFVSFSEETHEEIPVVKSGEIPLLPKKEFSANAASSPPKPVEISAMPVSETPPVEPEIPHAPEVFSFPSPVPTSTYSPSKPQFQIPIKPMVQLGHRVISQIGVLLPKVTQRLVAIGRRLGTLGFAFLEKLKKLPAQPAAIDLKEASQGDEYLQSTRRANLVKLVIGVAIIGALLVVGRVWWQHYQQQQQQAAQQAILPLTEKFQTAVNLVASDPVAARQQMQNTLAEMEQLAKEAPNNSIRKRVIQAQLTQAQAQFTQLSGQEQAQSLPIFADLRTQQSDFIATQMMSNGQQALFIDAEKKSGLVLTIADGTLRALSLADLAAFSPNTWYKDNLFLIDQGINQIDISGAKATSKVLVPEGDSNKTATHIAAYTNYLYVLNPIKHNIYRYLNGPKEVSDPIGWIKPGQPLPYDQVTDMEVDGDMWLSTNDGKIIKLTAGEIQPFDIKGLQTPFAGKILLTTREDDQQLYILEPGAKRLVILNKNGDFIKQVQSPSLAAATDLLVTADKTKVLVVSGSLVFSITL